MSIRLNLGFSGWYFIVKESRLGVVPNVSSHWDWFWYLTHLLTSSRRREAWTGYRTCVCTGNRNRIVSPFARGSAHVVVRDLGRRSGRLEFSLFCLWGCVLQTDGGRLELECGLRSCRGTSRGILGLRALLLVGFRRGFEVLRLRRSVGVFGRAWASWCVGRGLEAQLRKVQIRPGLVALVH